MIWDSSEVVGFGFVRQLPGAPAIQQQEAEIFAALKGDESVVRMAPLRVNGVGRQDGMIRWFYSRPDEVRLIALVHTPEGAVTPTCLAASIASKPASDLYPALVRIARSRLGARP